MRCMLLSLFLASSGTRPTGLPIDLHCELKALRMIGTALIDELIADTLLKAFLNQLLQNRLVILQIVPGLYHAQVLLQLCKHIRGSDLPALVHVNGTNDCLKGISENRRPRASARCDLTVSKEQILPSRKAAARWESVVSQTTEARALVISPSGSFGK